MTTVAFTDEELAEFTLFNVAANDWCRLKAQGERSIPPCWLCMSEDAKHEARVGLTAWLNRELHKIVPFTIEDAEKYVNKNCLHLGAKIDLWKKGELELKKLRIEGDPNAFFSA